MRWIMLLYQTVSFATFIFLTFLDGYVYTWWNWIIAIPVNIFLSELWPIYWGILRWTMAG
jgi:hypothetical protein